MHLLLECSIYSNLKEYFYPVVEGLPTYNLSITNASKVTSLKLIVANAQQYQADKLPITAENEIKKAL